MRAVIQRVSSASVRVEGETVGSIGPGLLVLLGVTREDTEKEAEYLLDRITGLRIFADDEGKMNRSLLDTGGSLLVVSQFTLCGDTRKGRRPSFDPAAPPDVARRLYEHFAARARAMGVPVETGVFQAMMTVTLANEGPVTFLVESK
jgi:D-tyrosyl-tRNA(Tyr) deacylase